MSVREKLKEDMKQAMKAGEKNKTSVLRMLLSELQYAETSMDSRSEMPDQEVLRVVDTYFKKLRKAKDDYSDPNKISELETEMEIVQAYLPKKASPDEVNQAIDKVFGSTEERNFGVLMKAVLVELGSSADGKLVNQLLRDRLAP